MPWGEVSLGRDLAQKHLACAKPMGILGNWNYALPTRFYVTPAWTKIFLERFWELSFRL